MLDKHLKWKDHINITENKLSKNLGLLHRAIFKCKSNEKPLFFINSQLTYLWKCCMVQHFKNKTKKLFSKQKQAIKIKPMADIHANLNSDEKI